MKALLINLSCLVFTVLFIPAKAFNEKQSFKRYKFHLTTPGTTYRIKNIHNVPSDIEYFDSVNNVMLFVSARRSNFKSVTDYLDYHDSTLEKKLRIMYGDSTLTLISYGKSLYYPNEAIVLRFRVTDSIGQFNESTFYFIHHKHSDIQISFYYQNASQASIDLYVNKIMNTLTLK